MDIFSAPGTKVKYTGTNGNDFNRQHIESKGIKVDDVLTVKYTRVSAYSSRVSFEEVDGEFNTVCFENYGTYEINHEEQLRWQPKPKPSHIDQLKIRASNALKKMQSGVAYHEHFVGVSEPSKHLRVGVNNALCELGAIAKLLIGKGIFTEEEYYESLVEFLERDVDNYEILLTRLAGTTITLGECGFGRINPNAE